MKVVISITMSLFIILEVATMLMGDASSKIWSVIYFCNQSVLIVGLLIYLKDFLNNCLVNVIFSICIVKIAYNCLLLISERWANWVNGSYYVGLVIVIFILLTLLCRKK